jgi:hypothetical protein
MGKCTPGKSIYQFTCECISGWGGTRCDTQKLCNAYTCQNGGTCVDTTTTGDKPVDVVMVIDNSYSIRQEQTALRDAAILFIQQLGPDDRVALFGFQTLSPQSYPKQTSRPKRFSSFVATTTAGKTQLIDLVKKSVLSTLSSYTPLWDTTTDAIKYALDNSRSTAQKAVVALTDGADTASALNFYGNNDANEFPDGDAVGAVGGQDGNINDDYGSAYVGADYIDGGVCQAPFPIFTIGLGVSTSTQNKLREVAHTSAGAYYYSPSGSDLAAIYMAISNNVKHMF